MAALNFGSFRMCVAKRTQFRVSRESRRCYSLLNNRLGFRACPRPIPAIGDEMRLRTAAALTIAFSTLASAEGMYPVSVPQECIELSNREGVPTLIENPYQAMKAKVNL